MDHETVATFAVADKAKADALRKRLLDSGRRAWLTMNTGPELTVSVNAALSQAQAGGLACEPHGVVQQMRRNRR